jgi:hypothetical protein
VSLTTTWLSLNIKQHSWSLLGRKKSNNNNRVGGPENWDKFKQKQTKGYIVNRALTTQLRTIFAFFIVKLKTETPIVVLFRFKFRLFQTIYKIKTY